MLAGLIMAFYGPVIVFETELLGCGIATFCAVFLVLLFNKFSVTKHFYFCFITGISGGISFLIRPTFIPFFVISCIWVIFGWMKAQDNQGTIVKRIVVILIGLLLMTIPVALLNYKVTGHFGIMPASGGINFYIGNNSNPTETIVVRPGLGWQKMIALPQQKDITGDMWERQVFFKIKVIAYLFSNPLGYLKGLLIKTVQFFSSREIPRNIDIYIFSKWSYLCDSLVWKYNNFGFPFGLLFPFALIGIVSKFYKIPGPMIIFITIYPASIVLVFVSARYRIPIIPILSVFSAAGAIHFVRLVRLKYWKHVIQMLVLSVCAVMIIVIPGPFSEEKINYEAEFYVNISGTELRKKNYRIAAEHALKALNLKEDSPLAYINLGIAMHKLSKTYQAILCFKKALNINPEISEAHSNLAKVFMDIGEIDQAIDHYTKAISLRPNYVTAHYHLGELLMMRHKFVEAIDHFKLAVKLKPDYYSAQNSLKNAQKKLKKINQ